MRFFRWCGVLFLLILVSLLLACTIYNSDWFQRKYLYPFPYQDLVYRYSREANIDPYLVAAVIREESRFGATARSTKGARGLMQMMPETGQWVARQLDLADFQPEMLDDPAVSIRLGTWYLASLQKEFGRNDVLALAAYNAGRGNVRRWMEQYGWSSSFRDPARLPFPETRQYVIKVLTAQRHYHDLYGH